jgi:hypothetical protein
MLLVGKDCWWNVLSCVSAAKINYVVIIAEKDKNAIKKIAILLAVVGEHLRKRNGEKRSD